jgi:hypothetical protein
MSEMRTVVQVNKGSGWQTVQVDAYRSYSNSLMRILMAQKDVTYPSIQGTRGFPPDLHITYDTAGFTTFSGGYTSTFSQFIRPSYVDGFYIGNHAFTWLTLTEMNGYQWTITGWMYPDESLYIRGYAPPVASVACADFYDNFLPKLNQIASDQGVTADNLRLIMGLVD